MATKKDFIKIVTKLNELTQSGELEWKKMDPPKKYLGDDFDFVEVVFVTNYKNKTIRAYEERFKHYYDEDMWAWATKYVLESISDKGQREWLFPTLSSVRDLIESIQYMDAGIDSFAQDVLGDFGED